MLKLIGNLIILSTTILLGLFMASIYRERHRFLVQLRTALAHLEEEMLTLGSPLPQALQRISEEIVGPVRELLRKFLDFYQDPYYPKERVLEGLGEEERQVIDHLLQSLGRGDTRHQRELFKTAQWRLSRMERKTEEEAKRYGRLWHYSGLFMGLMLIILLY